MTSYDRYTELLEPNHPPPAPSGSKPNIIQKSAT